MAIFRFRENEIENPATVDAFREIATILNDLTREIESGQFGSNHLLEGYATGRNVLRSVRWRITPGATPGTNITIITSGIAGTEFNIPGLASGTDLGKGATVGDYSLNAGGSIITVNTTETVVGIISTSFVTHDVNTSSTTGMWIPWTSIVAGKLTLGIIPRGTQARVDWTTIMDAGDRVEFHASFITST